MTQLEIKGRVVELAAKAEERVELALKMKTGLLVSRSPLFVRGKKVPIAERQVQIFRTSKELKPGQILARRTATASEPQLAYSLKGPRENYVKQILTPAAATKDDAMKNVAGGLGIRKAFTGHLDRRGITSRAHASAFGHEAIPTEKLVKRYKAAGYKVEVSAAKKAYRSAEAGGGREYAQMIMRGYVPMVRKPRATS